MTMRYYLHFQYFLTEKGQFMIVSFVGMTAFKKVSKASIGKFKQKILLLS